jgi:hypothetical protein
MLVSRTAPTAAAEASESAPSTSAHVANEQTAAAVVAAPISERTLARLPLSACEISAATPTGSSTSSRYATAEACHALSVEHDRHGTAQPRRRYAHDASAEGGVVSGTLEGRAQGTPTRSPSAGVRRPGLAHDFGYGSISSTFVTAPSLTSATSILAPKTTPLQAHAPAFVFTEVVVQQLGRLRGAPAR